MTSPVKKSEKNNKESDLSKREACLIKKAHDKEQKSEPG